MKHLIELLLIWFALGIAATALAGHLISQPIMASWFPNWTPMAVSTGCALLSLSVAMLLRWQETHQHKP